MAGAPKVFIVDDDELIRDTVVWLMQSVGLEAVAFGDAAAFLSALSPETRGCLILDLRMPGMGGLRLQAELEDRGVELPIIFHTAHGDVPAAVRAMKHGAVDFMEKPFNNQDLIDTVQQALSKTPGRGKQTEGAEIDREILKSPTAREREVLSLLVSGHTNKEISAALEISIKTVEFHRANIMRKTGVNSLSDLIRKTAQVTLVTP